MPKFEYTEAKKRANAEYFQRTKGRRRTVSASFLTEEAEQIQATFAAHGLSVGDVLRRSAKRLEEGKEL